MGWFGGDDITQSTQQTTNNAFDKRLVVDSGLGLTGDGNTLSLSSVVSTATTNNIIDGGALKIAADATRAAIDGNNAGLMTVVRLAGDTISTAESITAKNGQISTSAFALTDSVTSKALAAVNTSNKDNLAFASGLVKSSDSLVRDVAVFAGGAAKYGGDAAIGAAKDALAFGNLALGAVGTANKDALAFGNLALQSSATATKDALAATITATNAAITASSSSALQSMQAVGDISTKSINAIGTVNSQSLSAMLTAGKDALALADRSQGLVAGSLADALGYGAHVVDLAFKSADLSQNATANAINQVARAYDTATNYQAEKATTDSRYLVIAGLVVVALAAIRMGVFK